MSAFIVSNRTMSRAIAALKYAGAADSFGRATDKELGDLLFDLNAEAVAQRYSEPKERVEYFEERGLAFTKIDAAKGLACLIYQCSEGQVPQSQEYKALVDAEQILANAIVAELSEYRNAAWDSRDDEPALIALV